MKKVFFFSMMAAVALMTSCGKGGPSENSTVNEAIEVAEKEVPLQESPNLGQLPSIAMQYSAALKAIDDIVKVQESKDMEEMSKKGDERKAAQEEMEKIYNEKKAEEAKKLDGKSVKVTFDDEYFTDVKATLKAVDSDGDPVAIEVKMTLAKPLPKSKWGGKMTFSWGYLDAQNGELGGGADFIDESEPGRNMAAGEVWTYTISGANVPRKEKGQKFDHLNINKPSI